MKYNKETELIKAAIEYGRMKAFNEMPAPDQFKYYSGLQLSKAANILQAVALNDDLIIEFDGNGLKIVKPLKGEISIKKEDK